MEEFKFIIYIILGVLYLLFKNRQKKAARKTKSTPVSTSYQENESSLYDNIFGDFLEENESIQEEKSKSTRSVKRNKSETKNSFKEGGDRDYEFERFNEFSIREEENSKASELFEDQDSVRNAFIAGEIFNRKY